MSAAALNNGDDSLRDADAEEEEEELLCQTSVLALVWRKDVLGAAWIEESSSVMRFCEAPDVGPDFRALQNLKFTLNPTLIVTPTTSDPDFLEKLGSACTGSSKRAEGQDAAGAAAGAAADDDDAPEKTLDPDGFMVTLCKNKDFSAEAAVKRLSLIRHLSDVPGRDLSERERQLHLEHILPPDSKEACRTVGGLLAHLQRSDAGGSSAITHCRLERCRLEQYVFVRDDGVAWHLRGAAPPVGARRPRTRGPLLGVVGDEQDALAPRRVHAAQLVCAAVA